MDLGQILFIIILIYSVILHEIAHGAVAYKLGDPTAKLQGRLTLNPLPHIDIVGSVIVPVMLVLSNAPILFGWAKPVPYNPYNLIKGGRYAELFVASAGIVVNFIIAIFAIFFMNFTTSNLIQSILSMTALVNIMLAIFNLLPIPPLDGSKVFYSVLPSRLKNNIKNIYETFEYNPLFGFGAIVVFLLVFGGVFHGFIMFVFEFLSKLIYFQ